MAAAKATRVCCYVRFVLSLCVCVCLLAHITLSLIDRRVCVCTAAAATARRHCRYDGGWRLTLYTIPHVRISHF